MGWFGECALFEEGVEGNMESKDCGCAAGGGAPFGAGYPLEGYPPGAEGKPPTPAEGVEGKLYPEGSCVGGAPYWGVDGNPPGPDGVEGNPGLPEGVDGKPPAPGVEGKPPAPEGVEGNSGAPEGVDGKPPAPEGVEGNPGLPEGVDGKPPGKSKFPPLAGGGAAAAFWPLISLRTSVAFHFAVFWSC